MFISKLKPEMYAAISAHVNSLHVFYIQYVISIVKWLDCKSKGRNRISVTLSS